MAKPFVVKAFGELCRLSLVVRLPARVVLVLVAVAAIASVSTSAGAQWGDAAIIKERHLGIGARGQASPYPRSEGDQAVVAGWPLYRTERGQVAFNDAMAALKATDFPAPKPASFKNCAELNCPLTLPAIGADGWLPAGRLWVSPSSYVLIVHSPRLRAGLPYRRRSMMNMRYFVLHEFHNSSRNTDLYDTISSHRSSVFVPLYMGKELTDVRGARFVIVVQVAPFDVVSVHASNMGSEGPGIEVAKNSNEPMEPLQGLAGILVAQMITAATPRLQVVNHHGEEGLPMLTVHEQRLESLRRRAGAARLVVPFMPVTPQRAMAAIGNIDTLIRRRGPSVPIPLAQRGLVAPMVRPGGTAGAVPSSLSPEPALVGPIEIATRQSRAALPTLVVPVQPAIRPAAPMAKPR